MNARKTMFAAVAAITLAATAGDTLTVSNNAYEQMRATTNVVTSVTTQQGATYPASAPQPLFWLDCSDRTDWTLGDYGTVAKIPSKAGSKLAGKRCLTTSMKETDWTGWTSGTIANKPYLRKNVAELMDGAGAYLDFRPNSWRCAMVFNTNETYSTSVLSNFGTVLWVRGSNIRCDSNGLRSGGHLLGGVPDSRLAWELGGNPVLNDEWNGSIAWNSRLAHNSASKCLQNGRIWLDGQLGAPGLTSYNGHWEVISLQCGNNEGQTLGIGMDTIGNGDGCGGELIAEMLIFEDVLTREQIEPIEMYLQQKWFGRGRAAWNGDGRLGVLVPYQESFKGEIAVGAGETLEVSRVQGGAHAGSELKKTGAGTLALAGEGVKDYTGDLVLNEGKVAFGTLRESPTTVDALADHLYARFDPSESASIVTETSDKTYVDVWSNLVTTAEAKTYGKPFCLRPRVANKRPWVVADALGDGLDVVDFGWFVNNGVNSMHLVVSVETTGATGSGYNNYKLLHNIQTVVLVLGAQGGGGHLFSSDAFARGARKAYYAGCSIFSDAIISKFGNTTPKWGPDITGREQTVWIDGRIWDESRGYEKTGYQVVAFQTAGASFEKILMEAQGGYSGGARIGEMLLWNRTLTEQEIRDAQAYLSAKWLKRPTPGYKLADGTGAAAEIQNLSVPEGQTATIDVAEGRTVRVGNLAAVGTLVKTGKGELDIQAVSGSVSVTDGAVKMAAARDVASADTYADGATMHVDASDAKSLSLANRYQDNASVVVNWADKKHNVNLRNTGFADDMSRTPHINAADCNGLDTVDFGYWGDSSAILPTHGGCWMFLDRPLHSMRAIYAVIKYHGHDAAGNGPRLGFLFSNQAASTGAGQIGENDTFDFHPDVSNGWTDMFLQSDRAELKGGCFTNGASTIVSNFHVPLDEYFLLELHPAIGYSGGVMGLDRTNTGRIGGFAIGELIVYEHPLSEREKVATRNYLLKKWFPDKALSDMPAAPAVAAFDGDLAFGANTTNSVVVKADGTAQEKFANVTGKLSFGKDSVIDMTGLGALENLKGRRIVVAHADEFEGVGNVKVTGDVTFTEATQPAVKALATGDLVVKFGKRGMVIYFW